MAPERSSKGVKVEPLDPSERRKEQKKGPPDFSDPTVLVTFLVGKDPNPAKFLVHKEFACHRSPVLEAAFNGNNNIEGQTRTYRLDDVAESTFRYFVHYLYSEKLLVKQLADDWDWNNLTLQDTIGDKEDLDLVYLWLLAERLRMPHLQNLVMETIELVNDKGDGVPFKTFNAIYENTTVGNKLRKYAFHTAVAWCRPSTFTNYPEAFPLAMLIDIANYWASKSGQVNEVDHKDFLVPVDEE